MIRFFFKKLMLDKLHAFQSKRCKVLQNVCLEKFRQPFRNVSQHNYILSWITYGQDKRQTFANLKGHACVRS
jgi:hypothetical protein